MKKNLCSFNDRGVICIFLNPARRTGIILLIIILSFAIIPGCKKKAEEAAAAGYGDVEVKDGIPTRIKFECTGKEYKTVDELKQVKKEDRY